MKLSCPRPRVWNVSEDCKHLTGILKSGFSLHTWLLQPHVAPCGISGEGWMNSGDSGRGWQGVLGASKPHHTRSCQLLTCPSGCCQLQDPEVGCVNHQGAKRGDLPVLGGLSKPIKFGKWRKLLPVRFLLAPLDWPLRLRHNNGKEARTGTGTCGCSKTMDTIIIRRAFTFLEMSS